MGNTSYGYDNKVHIHVFACCLCTHSRDSNLCSTWVTGQINDHLHHLQHSYFHFTATKYTTVFIMTKKQPIAHLARSVTDLKLASSSSSEKTSTSASTAAAARTEAHQFDASAYTAPFLSFLTQNPTVFHAVQHFSHRLSSQGFTKLSEREQWSDKLERGGKYYVERNGSCLLAFVMGANYKAGNGAAVVAGHIDALTARRKSRSGNVQTV